MRKPGTRGFSLLEMLVSASLALALLVFVFEMWRGSTLGVLRGEGAQDSLHEAALLMARLRRDLVSSTLEEPGGGLMTFVTSVGGSPRARRVLCESGARRLRTENLGLPAVGAGETRLEFFLPSLEGSAPERVVWRYDRARSIVAREAGGRKEVFGGSHLKAFTFEMAAWPRPGVTGAALLLPDGTSTTLSIQRFWYRIRLELQGEIEQGQANPARVTLDSLVFPKHLNRLLQADWSPEP